MLFKIFILFFIIKVILAGDIKVLGGGYIGKNDKIKIYVEAKCGNKMEYVSLGIRTPPFEANKLKKINSHGVNDVVYFWGNNPYYVKDIIDQQGNTAYLFTNVRGPCGDEGVCLDYRHFLGSRSDYVHDGKGSKDKKVVFERQTCDDGDYYCYKIKFEGWNTYWGYQCASTNIRTFYDRNDHSLFYFRKY